MDMLKEHSEKLKEAIMAANKFKDLQKAKQIVADAAANEVRFSWGNRDGFGSEIIR